MKDQVAEVFLQTPLLILAGREETRSKPALEHLIKVMGKIVEENAGGIVIAVKGIGSSKVIDKTPPFSQIFIPYHKIDYIVFGNP